MATLWIHGGVIPPCPCGAPPQDQVRRPDGGDRSYKHCLICNLAREHDPGWDDPLVPISEDELRARSRAMTARARWRG